MSDDRAERRLSDRELMALIRRIRQDRAERVTLPDPDYLGKVAAFWNNIERALQEVVDRRIAERKLPGILGEEDDSPLYCRQRQAVSARLPTLLGEARAQSCHGACSRFKKPAGRAPLTVPRGYVEQAHIANEGMA